MAVDLGPQKPPPKYERFVEDQLARARGRIRALDAAAIGLVLLLGTLIYCLVMTLLDQAFELPVGLRLAGFVLFVGAALLYLARAGYRLLSRRINPYYAAKQIEQTLPDAKNSVVNWLDLREANLPPVIRGALGQRAARDLKQLDLEQAISSRRTAWLGGAVLAFFIGVLVLALLGGGQFFSLLERAFAPFQEVAIATRTMLVLIQPENGNATVPVGRPVRFRVQVSGRVPAVNQPDSIRLHYRYNPADPYLEQPLEADLDGVWTTTLLADQVQAGVWYKISGGDTETPEYQVRVRSQAQVTGFEVRYHYRPYLHRSDQIALYPNEDAAAPHLNGPRGTEVTLTAQANRPVKEGWLEMEMAGRKKTVPGELRAGEADKLQYRFPLEESGTYSVQFTSRDRESNTDRDPYRIRVIADRAPLVELTKPGKDVQLPANGTLPLEGRAEDDFGITQMTLRLRVSGGPVLQARPYRAGKSFQLAGGGYPIALDYKDFVELEKVKTEAGAPFGLKAGMELKYWLEATDNCDYPKAQVGRSKEYAVKIVEPSPSPEQQKQRQAAQQSQKEHEQQQDQKLEQENQAAQGAPQNGQGTPKEGAGQGSSSSEKEFQRMAQELENAINNQEKRNSGSGQGQGVKGTENQGAKKQEGSQEGTNQSGSPKEPQSKPDQGPDNRQGSSSDKNVANASKTSQKPSGAKDDAGKQEGSNEGTNQSGSPKEQRPDNRQGSPSDKTPGKGSDSSQNQSGAKDDGSQSGTANQQQPMPGKKAGNQENGPGKTDGSKTASQTGTPKDNAGQPGGKEQSPNTGQNTGQGKDQKTPQPGKAQDQGSGQPKTGDQQASASPQNAGKQGNNEQVGSQPKGTQKTSGTPKTQAGGPKTGPQNPGAQSASTQEKSHQSTTTNTPAKSGDAAASASQEKPEKGGANAGSNNNNDAKQPQGAGNENSGANARNATKQDVAKLNEALKGADAKQAAEQLSRIGQEASDPQVRKAAEDALKNARAQAMKQAAEATSKDVERLKQALKDAAGREGAAEALSRISEQARDPQARKAAQDALNEARAQARKQALEASSKDVDRLKEGLKDAASRQNAAEALSRIAEEARDPQARKAAREALEQAAKQAKGQSPSQQSGKPDSGAASAAKNENPSGQTGKPPEKTQSSSTDQKPPNGDGQTAGNATPKKSSPPQQKAENSGGLGQKPGQWDTGDNRPQAVNEDASRRGGVLQLEELRKKVTPELLKELKWTPEDWQKFLEQARRYEAARNAKQPLTDKDRIRSGSSLLPSVAPRQVGTGPESRSDVSNRGQALPPPEFREAQDIFTSRPSRKD
jgi:hypothetical protein